MDLLAISNMYDVISLQIACEKKLCVDVKVENALEAWISADLLQYPNLLSYCEYVLRKNWRAVQATTSFTRLMKENPDKISKITVKLLNMNFVESDQ